MVVADGGTREWIHPGAVYPEPVRAELARRRDQILVRAVGRTLDLDHPGSIDRFLDVGRTRLSSRPEAPTAVPEPATGAYDTVVATVVATGVLAGFADLGAITAALAALLGDDGVLLFVEPVGVP